MAKDRSGLIDGHAQNGHRARLAEETIVGPKTTIESDLPPLSEDDQTALVSFNRRQHVLRDLTLGCIAHHHTGAYIYGPPGASKSYTILNTLREMKVDCRHLQRITAKPLYLEMEKSPGAVFVIDDCEQLFAEKAAQTLLRAALGGERVKGRRERLVTYSVTGSRARVLEHYFFGAIIFTGNRPLADERPEIRAVLSRIPSINFAPPDIEIRALMRHVARKGYIGETGQMSPRECVEVIEFVIGRAAELKRGLDLRWIEHAYGHYLTEAVSGGSNDWRDSVKFHLMSTITYFDHAPSTAVAADQSESHSAVKQRRAAAIAKEIDNIPNLNSEERVKLWQERTVEINPPEGMSRATYYRYRRFDGGADPKSR
jgi:hypothetical protein